MIPGHRSLLVVKADRPKRYTRGVLYTPGQLDAHGEFASAADLQEAAWSYVLRGDLDVRDMHDTSKVIGRVVEIMTWPFEVTTKLSAPGQKGREVTLPTGTVYVGVIWTDAAWKRVGSGEIAGYSLGGKTVRIHDARSDSEIEPMGKREPRPSPAAQYRASFGRAITRRQAALRAAGR
jgi:hypothetical protein